MQQGCQSSAAEFMAVSARVWLCAHTHTSAHISASVIACAVEIVPSRILAGFVNWQFLCRTKSLCVAISLSLCLLYAFIPREVPHSGCMLGGELGLKRAMTSFKNSLACSRMAGTFISPPSYYNTHCALSFSLAHTHTRPYKCMHNAALLFAF
jgi:hypothetical protein